MTVRRCDLAIIGAGPAGLYGAYYAGFRGLKVAVLDSLPEPGGQVAALYPEKLIFDVAGFPAVKGQDLIERCVEQAAPYDPLYLLGHRAETLDKQEDGSFVIGTHKGVHVATRAVVITGGIGTFTPRPLPDADDYEGKGVVCELEVMRNKDVLIVGGGDSACDWALNLEGIARSITLIHRRDRFRAHQDSVDKLMSSSVRVMTFTEVARIQGANSVELVEVFDDRTDERETLKVQAVVAALGFKSDLGPLKSWDIEIDRRHVLVDTRMETTVPGVFAAGDITEYDGKVRLISVGFGEAATAGRAGLQDHRRGPARTACLASVEEVDSRFTDSRRSAAMCSPRVSHYAECCSKLTHPGTVWRSAMPIPTRRQV